MPVACIIDTDPGVDDVLAILLALASPDLLVLSITLTHGNCTLAAATANLEKLFWALDKQLAERPDERTRWHNVDPEWRSRWGAGPIEVYLGSEGPIEGEPVTAKYFHGKDGLGDCTTRHPDLVPPPSHVSTLFTLSPKPALDGVQSLLARHAPRSIAYVALGPMTSLAYLHRAGATDGHEGRTSPLDQFSVVLSMGGAVDHPGNTSPVAEFNYYADPFAASVLFALAPPNLYIFPLDLTSYLTLPFSLYISAVDPSFSDTSSPSSPQAKAPLTHFTSSFLERTREVMLQFGSDVMEQHDPTVVYALIDWAKARRARAGEGAVELGEEEDKGDEGEFAPGWAFRRVEFEVETTGSITRGMLVRDLRASSTSSTSLTARTGLTNRAAAIEALDVEEVEAHRAEGELNGQQAAEAHRGRSGARVVVSSPGSEPLRRDLLKSIWGVDVAE
ncbi:uncharacterized protein RHOBADRAFT_51703 [Rhodotorula graminis WP1]|uniref:Inosine/uridine-preferring nucleoside hydrolase domain-containing protein n=1 Tax=Rhodotorula graminis (strain WP1) TaxID=578459 RepID=A0A194SBB5_RHOGW|nr:uncharacterized protein RHOBADRAFT_51703 [Rhodotorula graminis WP1]KPV76701.1 hypothetical protein RHOBADRAFT_51703 [Rhodotorula graminis WP1]